MTPLLAAVLFVGMVWVAIALGLGLLAWKSGERSWLVFVVIGLWPISVALMFLIDIGFAIAESVQMWRGRRT